MSSVGDVVNVGLPPYNDAGDVQIVDGEGSSTVISEIWEEFLSEHCPSSADCSPSLGSRAAIVTSGFCASGLLVYSGVKILGSNFFGSLIVAGGLFFLGAVAPCVLTVTCMTPRCTALRAVANECGC